MENISCTPEEMLSVSSSLFITLAFLYACEIWDLTLKEKHRLSMFANRVLRRISGPKRGSGRRLEMTA
jgi:hypothetical protein